MANYTLDDLAQMIDHTNLHADVTQAQIEQLCLEATKYHFKTVTVNSVQTKLCSQFLAETEVLVGAAISYPLGQTSIPAKAFEAEDAISNGAKEIDYVLNLSELKNGNDDYIKTEMQVVFDICSTRDVICKTIFETGYLTDEEIERAVQIALQVNPNFIITGSQKASVEDVKLLKGLVGEKIKIKAAGGIDNLSTMLSMIQAGARRIGTSSGIKIIEEAKMLSDETDVIMI
ncbi:deoxyribose-phosphate aldolase [Xylocopilactobacillus apicola]|uniref:Deoxyribose-phosphate aldolase n=1 Tax=Xylocopilactobacillus apicola TaxID=2932184 RepID=A0AAU9D682_9LACO|nr:deoxyribose-phosphate aldolase [Xylocopilactobacillus apicola]BDR59053.1 deoxyribose-phosphate aldolase [Xylocopilactobacillus apicola]